MPLAKSKIAAIENPHDRTYLDLLQQIMDVGNDKDDRTQTGVTSIFGAQMRFDLQKGFPLLTTKKVHWKSIAHELLWFISGSTNIKYLKDNGVTIWDEWADANGDLGPVYGKQWRAWDAFIPPTSGAGARDVKVISRVVLDQLGGAIKQIKENPTSRRIIVTAWNPAETHQMALPPCHCLFQFYVADGKLSCQLYQRSADMFLGVPFNIASYALLTHMVAHVCGLEVGEFIWTGGDCHIYSNHYEQVNEQLKREPKLPPTLKINRTVTSIDDFKFEDFEVEGYDPHPAIKAPVAV